MSRVSLLVFLSVLCLAGKVKGQAANNITRCDQLPKNNLVLPNQYLFNPYRVWFSMNSTFNCTSAVTTGPAPLFGQNATFLMLAGNKVKYMFSVDPEASSLGTVTMTCDAGQTNTYSFLVFQVTQNSTHICPYVCEDDGDALKIFRCYGHTESDRDYMRAAIDQYVVNVKGYANITDMQVDCADANDEYCEEYFI